MITQEQLKKIEEFAREKHKNSDYNHDINHIIRAVKLSQYLAEKEGADKDVCLVTAWLHDVGQSITFEKHNETGAKLASEFLKSIGFDDEFIEKVKHCIICHSSKRVHEAKTIEAKVTYDADMLQGLGPFGFTRILTCNCGIDQKNLNESLAITKEQMKDTIEKIQTKTARNLIKDDLKLIDKFLHSYEKWDKVDLK